MRVEIYDVLHIITDFQLILLIILLVHKGIQRVSNRLLAFFFLGQLMVSIEGLWWHHYDIALQSIPLLAYIGRPFIFIWGPAIYLFILSEVRASFRFRLVHLLHFLPSILIFIYFLLFFYIQSPEVQKELITSGTFYTQTGYNALIAGMIVQILAYTVSAIIRLHRGGDKKNYLTLVDKKRRQWNQFILHGYFVTCLIYYISIMFEEWISSQTIRAFLPFLFFSIYFTAILYRVLMNSNFNSITDQNKSRVLFLSRKEGQTLLRRLEAYIEKEKPYLDFDLSLSKLAGAMEVKERYLSQVINEFRQQNFHDFINGYRVEEAKRLLEECVNTKKTILEVIYQSGFNSKTAFNVAFKKQTGLTPTQFKNSFIPQKVAG